ncbi:hypothetical protein RLIN73S_06135 [Rhodanobacter lindaniclasticus]
MSAAIRMLTVTARITVNAAFPVHNPRMLFDMCYLQVTERLSNPATAKAIMVWIDIGRHDMTGKLPMLQFR